MCAHRSDEESIPAVAVHCIIGQGIRILVVVPGHMTARPEVLQRFQTLIQGACKKIPALLAKVQYACRGKHRGDVPVHMANRELFEAAFQEVYSGVKRLQPCIFHLPSPVHLFAQKASSDSAGTLVGEACPDA